MTSAGATTTVTIQAFKALPHTGLELEVKDVTKHE